MIGYRPLRKTTHPGDEQWVLRNNVGANKIVQSSTQNARGDVVHAHFKVIEIVNAHGSSGRKDLVYDLFTR